MKKIILFLGFLCIGLLANAQCNQTFTVSGQDDGPTVLTINAVDLTCQGAGTITALQLINSADSLNSGFCTTDGTSWYGFNLSIDSGTPVPVCDGEINGTDITGFTTLTITSQDNDAWSDGIDITIDVEVTFTSTTPPNCDTTLTSPVNGETAASTDGVLVWSPASGGATGYNLTVGTTSGGNDVLATTPLGNVTTYNLGALAPTTSYFVTIEAFNAIGTATGCIEQTFTTYTPVAGDTCDIALPIACGGSEAGTTVGATSNGAPAGVCGTGVGAPGVWYNFTGNGDIITASLCNSAFDTKIQVYEGSCAALVCVTGNDDACPGFMSEVSFVSTAGTEYYIYVFGFGTDTGNYQLDITCVTPPPPPANDDCANAIDLTVNTDLDCTAVTAGTVAGATASPENNATCGGTANNDVWYTFTASNSLHTISLLNIVGSTADMYMGVFEGTCAAFTEVLCSDAEAATVNGLTVGTQYTVRVYTWNNDPIADTVFDICVGTPPTPITTDIATYTPEQLITDVLIDADCATVTNIQYESHSTGADIGFSYFTDGGPTGSFPFENGIVLSSGRATDAAGPYAGGVSGGFGGPGDVDLQNETGVANTNDATYIEFDFVPIAPQISFNFIMASSEYEGAFQCTYEDAFAFILTDQAGNVSNLALLPTTDTGNPFVSVTNIHPEVVGSCAAANEQYFGEYTPASGAIGYTGRTVPLTAFSMVNPGETYHIKLVVADQADDVVDTAIFIEGGSFSLGNVDLGDDVFLGDPEALCEGDETTLNAGVLPSGTAIKWFKDGNEITGDTLVNGAGETEQILNIDTTGDYTVSIYFVLAPDCSRENTVHIEFYPNPAPNLGEDLIVCANKPGTDGVHNDELILDANVANATDPNMGPLNYVWEYNGVEVQNSASSTLVITPTTVVASTNSSNGSVQFENPIDGSTTYANVIYSVNGVATDGVYSLGKFTVTVTDTVTNCSGESEMYVSYYENANCVTIPTGISPNGDGVNDCLVLDNLSPEGEKARLQVYNRYGTRVYDNAIHEREWCGTDQEGNALITGTYYYVLDYHTGNLIKGWVYINIEN